MHVWGIIADLDSSIASFLITLFLIAYGLVYVVKNAASKYFVVDDSFEGGGGGEVESSAVNSEEGSESGGLIRAAPVMTVDESCVVCGEIGKKKCSLCKAVRYCTVKCQAAHWRSEHKKNCKKVPAANGAQKSLLKKVLFPYDEFLRLYNWDSPGFPPCGLLNCGNSCFANVVLQCLTYTKPLAAYLLEKRHQRECKKAGWCFLCEFEIHVDRASRSTQAFSPFNILSRLPHIGGNLGFGNQEDAHEFMRFAIDSMQSVFLDQFGGEKALHPSSQETTLIQYIFGGHLLSQVKCITCSKVSNRYESMMDLTVEIHGDNDSLEECLDQFTTPEWLDGENMYKCDGCNAYVNARKRLSIQQPPNILTIALKRFQSGRFGKLNKRVTFPETLDLGPYMTNAADGTDVYNLYAVVVHIDMLNASYFGHYICYIKDFRGHWYRIDDCKVVEVDVDEVLSAAAYMLLYCRDRPRESHQMPTEPSEGPEPVEKLLSFSTSFPSVATSASNSWGVHIPVKPLSACDDGDSETKDEATSKYISYEHDNGRTDSLSPSNGIVVYDNGHSDQGSDSGSSSSIDRVLLTNGNGHHNLGLVARSPSCNDASDPMEISDGDGITQKEIRDREQAEMPPAKRKKEVGADSGLSDVCNMDSPEQKKKDSFEGLFRRGFLNQNGNKLSKKVNRNITNHPPDGSIFKNGNCCSSIVVAECSGDTSPQEKLSSDVEEILCADVKGHMNMSNCVSQMSDQQAIGSLHTASDLPSCSPDSSSEEKCRPDINKLPCNGDYFSADSAECVKDIKIDAEETPSSSKAEHSTANGSPENVNDASNADHVNGYPSSPMPSDAKFCSGMEIFNGGDSLVSPSSPDMEIDGEASIVSPSNTSSSSGGKFYPEVKNNELPAATPSGSSSSSKGRFAGDGESCGGSSSVSSLCCNEEHQQ